MAQSHHLHRRVHTATPHGGIAAAVTARRPSRCRNNRARAASSSSQTAQPSFPLEAACSTNAAAIGVNSEGYRGLLATADIAPDETVLRIPLHNMLQVPRQQPQMMAAAAAAAAALDAWQQQHFSLPPPLTAFLAAPDVVWEAKLVAWLLHLQAAAPAGSLWRSYCRSLPAAADAITFCSYSEAQAEQLQFSVWKGLADKQRQLLQTVQQQCQAAGLQPYLTPSPPVGNSPAGSSSKSSSTHAQAATSADYAWALSMVKSRTFGQKLPPTQPELTGSSSSSRDTHSPALQHQQPEVAAASEELEGDDDSDVVLLMAPFIDMINHAANNNCVFGIDPGASSFSVRSSSSRPGIKQGQEVTISYGTNKSNLALLSCYGFQIPANPNDTQLLAPIFASCLAAAGDGVEGFPAQLLQAAAQDVQDAHEQQQQQQQQHELLHPDLVTARRRCALAALPVQPPPPVQQPKQQQQQCQQLKYLAQLMLYQLGLIFKRCGTSIDDDLALLQQLQEEAAMAGHSDGGSSSTSSSSSSSELLDRAIQQQAVAARLEHKLLLRECDKVLQCVLARVEAELAGADARW